MENVNVEVKQSRGLLTKSIDYIKKIPSSLKGFFVNVKKSYSASWKLQLILKVFIILLFTNIALMTSKEKHYDIKINPDDIITNSFYLTTTQLTTIGYGDITPKTNIAKLVVSVAHLFVMFIAYSLAEEFGAVSKAVSQREKIIQDNFKNAENIVVATQEFKEEIMKNNAEKRLNTDQAATPRTPINVFKDSVISAKTAIKTANTAASAVAALSSGSNTNSVRSASLT